MESFQTDTASGIRPTGGCACGGRRRTSKRGGVGMVDDAVLAVGTSYAADKWGRKASTGGRHRRTHKKGGVGMVDDALFAVGTSYAADKWGRKAPMAGRRRRTVKRGGAGMIDDAIVAGSALTLANYFAKKRGGKKLPRRLTKKTLV